MDTSIVIAMFSDARAVRAAVDRLEKTDIDRDRVSEVHVACPARDRCASTALLASPGERPLSITGFLVGAVADLLEEEAEAPHLFEAALHRLAVPRSSAVTYRDALRHGQTLLAIRVSGADLGRACRVFETAGALAQTVHHSPKTPAEGP